MSERQPQLIREPKILVVDDDPASLRATSHSLRSAGFEVVEASSGARAAALAGQDIDLLVVDIDLPDIDASDVRRQLRAHNASAFLPVVQLSAMPVESGARHQGLAVGADSCLVHRADPAALIATVGALLFARRATMIDRCHAEGERERLVASELAARAELARGNAFKAEFLSMLSHELRNPLNAILGWARVLARVPDATPLIAQGIEAIERNSRLQSQLIADLLDFAAIQFGNVRLDPGVIDPVASIQAALEQVAPQALAKGVHLESLISDRGARVLGDESRLRQVVRNLLSNAIKFTPKGGRIDLCAQASHGFFRIEIADTGQGISPELLPRIFDQLSRQDSGDARSLAGLGIGLTIVRHLVEAHRGTIEAHSAGEGLGASFRVRLPLAQEEAVAGPAKGAALLSGIHVLVVEDDIDARALVARLLNDAGACVREASGADEALAQVGHSLPHVLVSDLGMASRDGYELMRALRACGHAAERLPAIALTAFTRPEDRVDAMAAGFQIHLAKPVNPEALSAAVATLGRPLAPVRPPAT